MILKAIEFVVNNLKEDVIKIQAQAYLLDFYKNILPEKQYNALYLYYNEDLSLSEIASEVGITRQGVRDSIKRGETELLKLEEKLMLMKKLEAIEEKVIEIKNALESEDLNIIKEKTNLALDEIYK